MGGVDTGVCYQSREKGLDMEFGTLSDLFEAIERFGQMVTVTVQFTGIRLFDKKSMILEFTDIEGVPSPKFISVQFDPMPLYTQLSKGDVLKVSGIFFCKEGRYYQLGRPSTLEVVQFAPKQRKGKALSWRN